MSRIFIIAQSEFLTLVKTKAFIIGIFLMPVLMGAFIFFMSYAQRQWTPEPPFAVIDETGVLYDAVAKPPRPTTRTPGRTRPHGSPVPSGRWIRPVDRCT
jgi:hypothetical protein